ncbi:MAG: hypothetical protein JEZ11_00660 [Desulfobacterales bacterium]|nr:hypothetical protein [Desulfobacterales bacterium]
MENISKYIFSVVGNDQPRILAKISRVVADLDFNIEDVTQVVNNRIFSSTFLISRKEPIKIEKLSKAIKAEIFQFDLDVYVKQVNIVFDKSKILSSQRYIISIRSKKKKAVLVFASETLANNDVNIVGINGIWKMPNKPGENIMLLDVDVPDETDLSNLKNELNDIAISNDLAISIQHKDIFISINRI